MFRKHISFLASIICLAVLCGCGIKGDGSSDRLSDRLETSRVAVDSTTCDTESTPIYTEPSLENTDVDIALDFEPYTLTDCKPNLPNEDEYESLEKSTKHNITILGYNCNCDVIKYRMTNGDLKKYTVCTDIATNEVLLCDENISIVDIDRDGSNEIISGGKLLMSGSEGIGISNYEASFKSYLESILEENAEYDFHIGFGNDYDLFRYTVYTQGEEAFEEHNIQIQYVWNGFDFVCDSTYFRDFYAPYESNDPNWNVDVSFTDIEDPHSTPSLSDRLYTLKICGPNGEQYNIYGKSDFPIDNAVQINTNEFQDARFDRKLIVHPKYDYAILMYPFAMETSSDIKMTNILLIDLKTGLIANSNSSMEVASTCLYNPYYLFDSNEEAAKELNKCDFMGINTCTITQDVKITDNGFEITINLRENNNDIVKSKQWEINLNNTSTSA